MLGHLLLVDNLPPTPPYTLSKSTKRQIPFELKKRHRRAWFCEVLGRVFGVLFSCCPPALPFYMYFKVQILLPAIIHTLLLLRTFYLPTCGPIFCYHVFNILVFVSAYFLKREPATILYLRPNVFPSLTSFPASPTISSWERAGHAPSKVNSNHILQCFLLHGNDRARRRHSRFSCLTSPSTTSCHGRTLAVVLCLPFSPLPFSCLLLVTIACVFLSVLSFTPA